MASNIKFKRTTGTGLPTGLTFAEPAFVLGSGGTTTANQLYIGDNSGGRVWIGAKIENTVTNWTGTEANTLLATQQAIDARITSRISTSGGFTFAATSGTPQTLTPGDIITIAAGTGISTTAGATDTVTVANTGVLSFNSLTGAVSGVGSLSAGTGISLSGSTGAVTVTNAGVQSAVAGSGISVSGATGAVTFTNTGVTGIQAGTGISVSSATGNPTITNTGVQSISGTANQITASGSTGAVTLSLPSAVTMPGSLTVTGDLTVNGTTTTVNSQTVQIVDPIISIGGLTGGIPPVVGDVKDRGIAFQYYSGTGRTGFFGHDTSTGFFTYVPNATVSSEVISGTAGSALFSGVLSAAGVTLTLTSGSDTVDIQNSGGANSSIRLWDSNPLYTGRITIGTLAANRTYTLPDHTGTVVVPSDLGTSGFILKANGTSSQPTWINPTAAGFTAYVSTNVGTTEQSTGTFYLTFAGGASTVSTLSVDATATNPLSYNVATATLSCGIIDAILDGGAY